MKLNAVMVAMLAWSTASPAYAAPETFDLDWSGAVFGNSARATGTITFDPSVLTPASSAYQALNPTAFSITVTGAPAPQDDGTFTLADYIGGGAYNGFYLDENGTLDFSTQLVGQATFGNPWGEGTGGTSGDFNINSNGDAVNAPTVSNYFEIHSGGDNLLLTSFAPAPAPELDASGAAVTIGLLSLSLLLFSDRQARRKG